MNYKNCTAFNDLNDAVQKLIIDSINHAIEVCNDLGFEDPSLLTVQSVKDQTSLTFCIALNLDPDVWSPSISGEVRAAMNEIIQNKLIFKLQLS